MKFIDIFAGMGGFRLGMEQAGHECVYSIEWDKHKRKIYDVIFGKEPEGGDIRNVRANELPRADAWCFGFPCQDISVAGKQEGFDGQRSSLFFAVTRLVRDLKEEDRPSYLIAENVKNFFSVNNGYDFLKALIELDEIGYDAEWQLLRSTWFGIPQGRERVFIIGHHRGKHTRKILPINTTMDCKNPAVTLTKRGYGSQRNGTYVAENSKGPRACLTPKREEKRQNGRRLKEVDKCMFTLTKQDMHGIYDGERLRILTPRECMRLQGVPDEITDKLIASGISDNQLYCAAGDGVTVNVIYEIAKRI